MTNRVPAEWEPQAAVWLAWPHNRETWPGRFEKIPDFFLSWAKLICESVPVRILVGENDAQQCAKLFGSLRNLELVDVPTNDCWIRDYGPTFVVDEKNQTKGICWSYNAWGGKYPPWDLDDEAGAALCQRANIPTVKGALCLEGGAMELDGTGRMLTTPECLITESRNPGISKQVISQELHRRLGVTEIVWIDGGGIAGDDTDGHIDQLARFIDPTNVVVAVSADPDDPSAAGLEQNYRQVKLWGQSTSPIVNVHRLPIPPARLIDGQRVPESYCNFLRLGPDRMLVPTFAADTDDQALGLLGDLSGTDVEAVDCRDLVWGLGALHCASRDQPLGA